MPFSHSSFDSLHRHYKSHWTDLPRRMATICLGVPILWFILLDDTLRSLFFQILLLVILYEWMRMSGSYSLWSIVLLMQLPASDDMFLLALVASVAVAHIFHAGDPRTSHTYMTGCLLIAVPFDNWMQVQQHDGGFGHVVSLLLVTWNVDTGSLMAGRLTGAKGQPRWLTQVSPGKSIAGLVGGLVGGVGTYVLLGRFWKLILYLGLAPLEAVKVNLELDTWQAVRIGALLSIAASLGDLWESSLKRQWGVKDSSKLLPGHGGVLDRFDSSLVAVLLYKYLIQYGMV